MKACLLLCLALVGASTSAQTIYRCGPDGRAYSQAPCEQGRPVDVSDNRNANQVAAAQARIRDDQTLGDTLQRERQAREARPAPKASHIDGRPAPSVPMAHAAKAPKGKKKPRAPKNGGDFMAVAPAAKTSR
ncbi:MAG TPA: hypothetical protein VFL64_15665 [Rhizobacter sp.]|nr:hypothetical protein [Rhizobacter sp.]